MIHGQSLLMIETIAAGLAPLLDRVVFIGGASTCLLIDDPAAQLVRPTDDVDCVMEIASRLDYSEIESELRRLGFVHDMEPGAPICRWRYKGVKVDVMPDDPSILGFSNRWYKEGIACAQDVVLPRGRSILCFTLPYFLASKIEAFKSRGTDFRTSHDVEDIVIVMDGRIDLDEISRAPSSVAAYLRCEFNIFLEDTNFVESVHGHLPPDPSNAARANRMIAFLRDFVASRKAKN